MTFNIKHKTNRYWGNK